MKSFLIKLAWIYGFLLFNLIINVIFRYERLNPFVAGGVQTWGILVLVFLTLGLILAIIASVIMYIWNALFRKKYAK